MEEELFQCSKCGQFLPLSDFVVDKKSKTRHRTYCKKCRNKRKKELYWKKDREKIQERQREYVSKNREKNKEKCKKYQETHKEELKEKSKAYREKNKEAIQKRRKKYREQNQEKIKERKKRYYEENKKSIIKKNVEYTRKRKETDFLYAFKQKIRGFILQSFKRKNLNKTDHTSEIVGCSIEDLINHLKETFYKNYRYVWDEKEAVHIDHIIPLKEAKTEEEVIKLCHWSNLQLLKPEDNLEKSCKKDWVLKK